MSFNDLDRGLNEQAPLSRGALLAERTIDSEFEKLATKVSTHIFRINSNVSGLQKLIDLLGSSRDTNDIRKKLHDLTDSTRQFIKQSSRDAKQLACWQVVDSYKIEQQKVSRDYANSLQAFQRISKLSVECQKRFVDRLTSSSSSTPLISHEGEAESHELSETRTSQQQQGQQQQVQKNNEQDNLIPDYELEYHEALIQERESEIREIETGINELNEIFRDLGTIVQEQAGHIDNIESNVHRISSDMRGAVVELGQAHEYQKKTGKKMICLLIIFIIVLSIILVAVLS